MAVLEIVVVLLLILLNGLLAMSELALVSSRRVRLEAMASEGVAGAPAALRLIADPGRFLSTVQIGITLVGILAGAFGGATIAARLGRRLDALPLVAPHGDTIAIVLVVFAITYLSLIVGELVPKRIALAMPERVAALVSPTMRALSRGAAPAVWLLRVSTDAVLRALRLSSARDAVVTEDEVRALIAEGVRSGIFVPREREMIDGVLRLADRTVRAVMTPRPEVLWLDVDDTPEIVLEKTAGGTFSRFPLCRGGIEHPIGIVTMTGLAAALLRGTPVRLEAIAAPALFVPDRLPVFGLLDLFRRHQTAIAIVVDEFGATEGVVTTTDILEAVAGDIPDAGEVLEPDLLRRGDGSWLVDGAMPIDEFEDRMSLRGLRGDGDFHTVAGFVLARLGRIPEAGEGFDLAGARFEVIDMDGRRIDKVLYVPATPASALDEPRD